MCKRERERGVGLFSERDLCSKFILRNIFHITVNASSTRDTDKANASFCAAEVYWWKLVYLLISAVILFFNKGAVSHRAATLFVDCV